jgi:hypothetical protein
MNPRDHLQEWAEIGEQGELAHEEESDRGDSITRLRAAQHADGAAGT